MAVFSLAGRSLKLDSEDDVADHVDALVSLGPTVSRIDLSGNTFGVGAAAALAGALRSLSLSPSGQNDEQEKDESNNNVDKDNNNKTTTTKTKTTAVAPSLAAANLADIFTGRLREEIPAALDHLLPALLDLSSLHTVDLSDNALGLAAVDPLAKFLSQHTPLQHLILANNGFGPVAGAKVATALSELADAKLKVSASPLETVVCGRNRLENGSMQAWSQAFAKNNQIREIRLYQNGIRQDGIDLLLTTGLNQTKNLQKLDLQDNTFTAKGALALAQVLPSWAPELVELGIGDCLLSSRGGEILATAFRDSDVVFGKLEILRLQYNEIEANGVKILADAINSNLPVLKTLELNGNKFSEDHPVVAKLNALFEDRGFGELDDLSDMEEESDEEEEEESEAEEEAEEEEEEIERGAGSKQAAQQEAEPVAQEESEEIDQEVADKIAALKI
ncbi:hypothetical protein V1514DRAFT_334981 [Lipomyces japonicus]|uniref:uncharacterized protein n=1 Tax=Lipomyces japonicus TaxID=56871 RepID=UPI0034D00902